MSEQDDFMNKIVGSVEPLTNIYLSMARTRPFPWTASEAELIAANPSELFLNSLFSTELLAPQNKVSGSVMEMGITK